MFNKLLTTLVIKLLRNRKFSGVSKVKITNELLKSIDSLPLRGTIFIDDSGHGYINGKKLDAESTIQLRSSAALLKESFAFKVVHEQARFLAIQIGVHQANTPEQVIFAKAALWFADEEKKLLDTLSGTLSTGE